MTCALGVPLHTEAESQVLALNRLNQPVVLGYRRDRQVACVGHALVMCRIDCD
jgi:hypothetical protein